MSELRIQLLGGFQVSIGARIIHETEWRLRKTKSLVKLLALAPGHTLHREQIIEVLWPDQNPDAAANNLYKAVYIGRRAIERDLPPSRSSSYLHLRGDSLLLRPPGSLWVDAEAFEQAAATARNLDEPGAYEDALRLYVGDLLPEDRYEDWAAGRREELQELYRALLLELARVQEVKGEPAAAIRALRRLVASDPAHEEAHLDLMRLHAQTGHRHQAVRQYQQLREALRRELDVEPASASRQLYQDILTSRLSPGSHRGASDSGDLVPSLQARRADEDVAAPLVGRDAALEQLEETLDAVFAGVGRLVLLAGEAGIGKSRLAAAVAERIRRRGGTALLGTAYEQEGRLPYGPFAEALESVGGTAVSGGLRALFGDASGDLARLTAASASAIQADRQRLFSAIADLVRRQAARSPVLLTLDDLHAADESSLQLLHYLARVTRNCAVLLLGTFRPEEAPPISPLAQLVGALRREQLSVRLDLERLGRGESDLFVGALLEGGPVDRGVFDTVHELAAGNPLYTEEVLRTLRESRRLQQVDGRWRLLGDDVPLPGPVLELLAGRVGRLGSAVVQVLSAAAVIGRQSSYSLLREVSELPDATVLDALDASLAHHALQETTDGYCFGHPLQRAALYEQLSLARRTSLHGRVAVALEQLNPRPMEHLAEALAHHWAMSEQPGRAVPYLVAAGDRATTLHANEVAVTAYLRAIEVRHAPGAPDGNPPVAAELWEKVGDLRGLAGNAPGDEDAYRAAIEVLEQEPAVEPDQLARLHRKAAYAALARHDVAAATLHLDLAEEILDGRNESVEWGRVRLVRALWLWERGSHAEGRRAATESLTRARQRGDGIDLMNSYTTLALVFHSSGEWKEGLQLEIQHIGTAADADPRLGLLFDAHVCLGEYHLYGDTSLVAVEIYARQTLELATRMGARRAQALTWMLLGESLLLRGEWSEAVSCLERSLELQDAVGSVAGQVFALQRLAEACVYRGDYAGADGHLGRALGLDVGPPMAPHIVGRVYATAALNALERGDPATAGRMLEEAAEVATRVGDCPTCGALLHPVATRTYVALGDLARAEHHALAAERVATHWESGAWWAMAETAQAAVLRARGDNARAAARFLAAAAAFERMGQSFDGARCLLWAGQSTAEGGDAVEARRLIEGALTIFDRLGAVAAARQAREHLTQA